MRQYDLFLSHNHNDSARVEALARRLLDKRGLRVWLDKWECRPGKLEPFRDYIAERLSAASGQQLLYIDVCAALDRIERVLTNRQRAELMATAARSRESVSLEDEEGRLTTEPGYEWESQVRRLEPENSQ